MDSLVNGVESVMLPLDLQLCRPIWCLKEGTVDRLNRVSLILKADILKWIEHYTELISSYWLAQSQTIPRPIHEFVERLHRCRGFLVTDGAAQDKYWCMCDPYGTFWFVPGGTEDTMVMYRAKRQIQLMAPEGTCHALDVATWKPWKFSRADAAEVMSNALHDSDLLLDQKIACVAIYEHGSGK